MQYKILTKNTNGEFTIPVIEEATGKVLLFDTTTEAALYARITGIQEFIITEYQL